VAPRRILARKPAWRNKEEEVGKRTRFYMNLDAPDQWWKILLN
jgi:hypothetical protein